MGKSAFFIKKIKTEPEQTPTIYWSWQKQLLVSDRTGNCFHCNIASVLIVAAALQHNVTQESEFSSRCSSAVRWVEKLFAAAEIHL